VKDIRRMAGIGPKPGIERGVGGFSSLYKDNRKKVVASAANYRCQKCLEVGHWTYDCTGTRKYVQRDSRTTVMKRKTETVKEDAKKAKKDDSSSDSSSSDSSSDSDSDSSSSSDDDDEEGDEKKEEKKKKKKKE